MIARERAWPRWVGLILRYGPEAFEAYLAQQITGYTEAVRRP
jgi:hypothetical protein